MERMDCFWAGRPHCGGSGKPVRSRDRIVGAVFVLVVVTAQARWMGSATTLLGVGLVIAYATRRTKIANDFLIVHRDSKYPSI